MPPRPDRIPDKSGFKTGAQVSDQTPFVHKKQLPPQRGSMSIEKGEFYLPLQRSGMFTEIDSIYQMSTRLSEQWIFFHIKTDGVLKCLGLKFKKERCETNPRLGTCRRQTDGKTTTGKRW